MESGDNVGYLPTMVMRELKAGRPCEITGGIVATVKTMEDYEIRKDRIRGKFGEIVQWRADRTALIATRPVPEWVIKILEAHMDEAPERWRQ